jgi:hypothetical protein
MTILERKANEMDSVVRVCTINVCTSDSLVARHIGLYQSYSQLYKTLQTCSEALEISPSTQGLPRRIRPMSCQLESLTEPQHSAQVICCIFHNDHYKLVEFVPSVVKRQCRGHKL